MPSLCPRRGSPSHDGVAGRLVDFRQAGESIEIEMQPLRWALRLVPGDASQSMAALCVTRAADGRWLAGRRAPWVSSWAGRWALGAGGAVDLGESLRGAQEAWHEFQQIGAEISADNRERLLSSLEREKQLVRAKRSQRRRKD